MKKRLPYAGAATSLKQIIQPAAAVWRESRTLRLRPLLVSVFCDLFCQITGLFSEMTAMGQENRESDVFLVRWCLCKNNSILGAFQSMRSVQNGEYCPKRFLWLSDSGLISGSRVQCCVFKLLCLSFLLQIFYCSFPVS